MFAQNGAEIEWAKTFGGTKGDVANSIVATSDGGYAVVGYTNSKGQGRSDFLVMKLDKNGKKVWEKTFGGKRYDVAKSVINTTDGGLLVTGETKSKGFGGLDVWLIKLNANGDLMWEKNYGSKKSDFLASFVSVTRGADDGFVVAGHSRAKNIGGYDIFIIKFDNDGKKVWEKTYGNLSDDFASSIITTPHGGYVLAGNTRSTVDGEFKFWFLQLDKNGSLVMERILPDGEVANSIVATSDGGYAVAGNSRTGSGESNMWIMKIDANLDVVWQKMINAFSYDYANTIIETFDENLIISGFSLQKKGDKNYNFLMHKLNRNGEIIWTKNFGGDNDDRANSLINTQMGTYVAVGGTKSEGAGHDDFHIIKFTGYLFDLDVCLKEIEADTLSKLKYLLDPKGEHEEVKDYNARISAYEQVKAEMIDAYEEKFMVEQAQKISTSYIPVQGSIDELSYYNADKESYKALIADKWYDLEMGVDDAKTFKTQWKNAKVQGYKRLAPNLKGYELVRLGFVHPESNEVYPVGLQVSEKSDETFANFMTKERGSANDSNYVAPQPETLKSTGKDVVGYPYYAPVGNPEAAWFADMEAFKVKGVDECMTPKMTPHKDKTKAKDEFEKTVDYEERVAEYNKVRTKALMECEEDIKFVKQEKIKNSYREVQYMVSEISSYNSTRKEYSILVDSKWYQLIIEGDAAVSFKENFKEIEVKGISRLNPKNMKDSEVINLKVYHTAVNKTYKVGKQVSPREDKYLADFLKRAKQ